MTATQPLLQVEGLTVGFTTDSQHVAAVETVSLTIDGGRTLGLVGESGCGKSALALSIMGLLPGNAAVAGRVQLAGLELLDLDDRALARLRGDRLAMVFQEPMTALNPCKTVGNQVAETLRLHQGIGRREAQAAAVDMLVRVGIPGAAERARAYPHQLSGGQRQRVVIAMALICRPWLLIADEPTTALDVTVQAQILDLMLRMQDDIGMAILFISHDLGVISEIADDVVVMYAGRVVEHGPTAAVLADPRHPYTRALLAARPSLRPRDARPAIRPAIIGNPNLVPAKRDAGCAFAPRCHHASAQCRATVPPMVRVGDRHAAACVEAHP